jgi:hypothetical protein
MKWSAVTLTTLNPNYRPMLTAPNLYRLGLETLDTVRDLFHVANFHGIFV